MAINKTAIPIKPTPVPTIIKISSPTGDDV